MHKFSPSNAERLESEQRYKLLPPHETLKRFGVRKGMTFVDIGAGTGYFTREAAKIVGSKGMAYAVEMSKEMAAHLKERGVPGNVQVIRSKEYRIPLDDSISDLTWLAFVVHENSEVRRFVREAKRVTKDGGRIVILEWKKQEEEHGPPMEERLSQRDLKKALSDFAIVEQGSLNRSHYYLVLEVRKSP